MKKVLLRNPVRLLTKKEERSTKPNMKATIRRNKT